MKIYENEKKLEILLKVNFLPPTPEDSEGGLEFARGGSEFPQGGLEFAEGGLEFAEVGIEFAIGYCSKKVIFRLYFFAVVYISQKPCACMRSR